MDKISPIKERILYFIDKQGLKKLDFCNDTGISYANMKGKGLESEIGGSQIAKILSFYQELSAEWLITGEGEMLKQGSAETVQNATEREQKLINIISKQNEQISSLIELLKSKS